MLNINKKLSKKGFSLIELMVAVVILAMAIFGIFHAYSVGFMGMADARERTVAVNYAREAMEDIKNMEFELITNENLSAEVTFDGKFKRNVIVSDLEDNLKKVITRVYWTKRDGDLIDVTTSMMINQMQFNPGVADHILLFSEKYELNVGGATLVTAIIKDANGNTKIDWSEDNDIGFNTDKGAVSDISETIKGVATAIYTASYITDDLPTTATITASVDGLSNILTLTITEEVTKIKLSASPDSIWADHSGNDGPYESTVTAELLDADDVLVLDATNVITFSISGEGNFIDNNGNILSDLITVTPSSGTGIALIKVQSIDNDPGTITITASSEGLVSDSIIIISFGDPTSIYVSIFVSDSRNYIYNDGVDSATVTVNILDQKSNSIPFTGEINLQGIVDAESVGSFNPATLYFVNEELLVTTFTCMEYGTVTITASGDGLTSGSSTIVVQSSLVATSISLSANPSSIPAGGLEEDASTITATIKSGAYIVENYKNTIYFNLETNTDATFSDGSIYIEQSGDTYGNDGVAEVKVIPAINAGTATITVTTTTINSEGEEVELLDDIEISFFTYPHHIRLSSDPQNIQVGNNKFELKAIMMDENNAQISTYSESVTFNIFFGFPSIIKYQTSNTQSLTTTFSEGEVIIGMKSVSDAGTAKINADSGMYSGSLNIPVGIDLNLVNDSPAYNSTDNSVSFDIEILGAPLTLEEIKVSWNLPNGETLNKIEIKSPSDDTAFYTAYASDYHDINIPGYPASSGDLINIKDDINLLENTSKIILYFNDSLIVLESGRIFDVIFNPNSGNYPIEFTIPAPIP